MPQTSSQSSLNFAAGPDIRWYLSVSPTLVPARLGNATGSLNLSVSPTRLRRYFCAVRQDARHTVRGQPRRKALRSYPAGQVRRKEKGCHYSSTSQTYLD